MREAGQRSQQYSHGLVVGSSKASSFHYRTTATSVSVNSSRARWERWRPLASRPLRSFRRAEQLYGCERFSRPWPKAVQRELRLLPRLDVDEDVVVFLLRRLALPIEVRWIVRRHLDARPARKDRILFSTSAAQQQVPHAIDLVEFGRVYVPVEHDDLQVLRVRGENLMRVLSFRDGPHAGAAEGRSVEGNEDFAD